MTTVSMAETLEGCALEHRKTLGHFMALTSTLIEKLVHHPIE